LTFVVDVLQVAKASVATDEPTITEGLTSTGATDVSFEDLEEGTGPAAQAGATVLVDLIAYRGDTGEKVDSTWGNGGPFQLSLSDGGALPGLIDGLDGMKLGGRRRITIPAEQAFGADGNADLGIPADTDLVVVIDLSAVF
jgi:peptidylprolyl isomerase